MSSYCMLTPDKWSSLYTQGYLLLSSCFAIIFYWGLFWWEYHWFPNKFAEQSLSSVRPNGIRSCTVLHMQCVMPPHNWRWTAWNALCHHITGDGLHTIRYATTQLVMDCMQYVMPPHNWRWTAYNDMHWCSDCDVYQSKSIHMSTIDAYPNIV